jgi:hypothetical protein
MALGNLELFADITYVFTQSIPTAIAAWLAFFLIVLPLTYLLIFTFYVLQHDEFKAERLYFAPLYAIGMSFKVLGTFSYLQEKLVTAALLKNDDKDYLMTLEYSFRMQVLLELLLKNLPLLILIAVNQRSTQWSPVALVTVGLNSLMLAVNLSFAITYIMRRWVDNNNTAKMRPATNP